MKRLGFKLTTHDFRHTKVTELTNSDMKIKEVQEYVGHRDPATTMRYVHVDVVRTADRVRMLTNRGEESEGEIDQILPAKAA